MQLTSNRRAMRGAVLVIALAAGLTQSALAQSTWDRYKPGSLSAVMDDADSTIRRSIREVESTTHVTDKKPSEHFMGTQYPTLATVIYMARSRPIDPNRLDLISAWGRSFMRDSVMAADFHREYLFQEGETLLWLPVQDTVASFFPKELHQGQPVNLYVMLLGGYYDAGKITWAFIVNEFNTKPVARSF